jgi:dipeptidyl aminopeptidase/acylaminoacyl peptidase
VRRIAFISARHADREWVGGNDIWVAETGNDEPPVNVTNCGRWNSLEWVDDEHLIGIGQTERGAIRLASPHHLDASGATEPTRIGDGEVTAVGRPQVRGDELFVLGVVRGATHLHRYDLTTGTRATVVDGRRQLGAFGISTDTRNIVFTSAGSNTPSELFDRIDGVERQRSSHTAPFLAEVELAAVEEVTVTSRDGYEVHALLCRPTGHTGNVKRPGLVYVHGGPLAHYGYGFFDEFQIAAAAGYVVIGANPRGSDGYGAAHAELIKGDLGNLDWLDVQATADALASQPDIDSNMIGIGGGSYGGFMTAWATGHTNRFRAALVERAVINWVTMEATSDIGWFVEHVASATTVDNIERLRRQSPITYARNVETPTLILHSDEDWRCPPEQAEQWHAALRRKGVDVRYVRFPGENHELTRSGRPSFRVARFATVHDFFSRYLPVPG